MRNKKLKSLALLVVGFVATGASAATYSAVDAFTDSYANASAATSGQFTFGYTAPGSSSMTASFDHKDGGSLAPFQIWNAVSPQDSLVPAAIYNPANSAVQSGTVLLGAHELALHPGKDTDAFVRFVAPAAGTYHFAATFANGDVSGTTTSIQVFRNASSIGTGTVNLSTSYAFGQDVTLGAGEYVQFNVGNDGGYYNDTTGLSTALTVTTAVPLPASVWGGGALLAGGVVARKLRRRA